MILYEELAGHGQWSHSPLVADLYLAVRESEEGEPAPRGNDTPVTPV